MKEEQTYVLLRPLEEQTCVLLRTFLFVAFLVEALLTLRLPLVEVANGLRPLADSALILLRRLISDVLFLLLFVRVYECA